MRKKITLLKFVFKMFSTSQKRHIGLALSNKTNSKNKYAVGQESNRLLSGLKVNEEKKPILRQTKLCLRKSTNNVRISIENGNDLLAMKHQKPIADLFIMPTPNNKYVSNNIFKDKRSQLMENEARTSETERSVVQKVSSSRQLVTMIGKVDFVINTMNTYNDMHILWDVFGKLIKIIQGKVRFERILLLRNMNGNGPVLQCIYYDMKDVLNNIKCGCCIRIIGHMTAGNALRAHKIKFMNEQADEAHLNRIQNINSFILQKNRLNQAKQ